MAKRQLKIHLRSPENKPTAADARKRGAPVFCIGANKTGTTSLRAFFAAHGYSCGDQAEGERIFARSYPTSDWKAMVDFARTADFHQDLPFSAAKTYEALDKAFPDALFILTHRSSAAEWYRSLTRFHADKFGDGTRPPTAAQLQAATYRYPGFMWEANRALYDSPDGDPYREQDLTRWYDQHLADARTYFAGRPSLLDINLSEPNAAERIARFAGFEAQVPLPHLNRTPA